jgi:predicted phage gp36 major capsid-like protein
LVIDPTVLISSAGSINPIRAISGVVQTISDTWNGVTSAGVVAEWLAEGAEAADASPTLGAAVHPGVQRTSVANLVSYPTTVPADVVPQVLNADSFEVSTEFGVPQAI